MNPTIDIDKLKAEVQDYADKRKGLIYAPIMHPAFSGFRAHHGHERFEMIAARIPKHYRTLLDIGSHWGYFAHRFEDLGFEVTAAENSQDYLHFLQAIHDLCGKKFSIWRRSVFELPQARFDVVLALNIFHHFIKTERVFQQFDAFLRRLECELMVFQPHNPAEGQMKGSFLNYAPEEFAEYVGRSTRLPVSTRIGTIEGRPLFVLSKCPL